MLTQLSVLLALSRGLVYALPQATQITTTTTTTTTGTPIGAKATDVLAPSIPRLPPGPNASSYPRTGKLTAPQPAPYTPAGGIGTNGSEPNYQVKSDFDFESLALGLYQEYIELDLFRYVLDRFSAKDFEEAGLTSEDRDLSPSWPNRSYVYPFTTVREFVDFSQKLTRWGESGTLGYIPHLNSQESGQIILQVVTVESREQMIFRQFDGLFPMPVWYEVSTPQSWQWTLLAPYISSCPENQTRLAWQNFPALNVLNNPNPARKHPSDAKPNERFSDLKPEELCTPEECGPRITQTRPPLSFAGREVFFSWENPGKPIGPDQSYITNTTAGPPAFVAWVTQLNVTYSPLTDIKDNTGKTIQPDVSVFQGDPAINGTMFVALTDTDLFVTPFNISLINPHVVAGPALYQAG
ncbi:MAG: hypothetical protein M1823_001337 [Watsoniomyces obsoletus]|nr:MAG: hypothetical protein M1823_001337 [Watsoniomyces obsoletus]